MESDLDELYIIEDADIENIKSEEHFNINPQFKKSITLKKGAKVLGNSIKNEFSFMKSKWQSGNKDK